jgi:tRNA pseudouridine38-40 synthase
MTTTKIALKLAYIGTNYSGFQTQPGRLTIEGTLIQALKKVGIIKDQQSARFSASGRTDKGVHALGAVIAFETDTPMLAIARNINSELPSDIWTWGRAHVPSSFDARRAAVGRSYRYILNDSGYDIHTMRDASELLQGIHDFKNFTLEKNGSTIREVKSIAVRVLGSFVIIDVTADSFLWNMVRRIVTGLMLVGSGKRDVAWVEKMLNPDQHEEGLMAAPPHGLILTQVDYNDVNFVEDEYAKKRAMKMLQKETLYHGVMTEMLKMLDEKMGGSKSDLGSF